MTVRINKPELNLREKISELDKPTGIAGEAMLRAETPQEQFNLIGAGRRNLIINGAMQVSQRGDYTTATAVANGAYSIDRWAAQLTSVTATIQHTARKQKLVATSTASGAIGSGQNIEITDTFFANKQITISAKVTSNSTNARIGFLYLGASNAWVGSASHTGGGTEETLTLTVTLPSAVTRVFPTVKICDTDGVSSVNISSGDYVEFGEVQLEVGKVATPFEHRSYGEELALCQRYYQAIPVKYESIMGQAYSSTAARFPVQLPIEMRANPSITIPPPGQTGYAMKPLTASLSWPGGSGINAVTVTSNRSFYITCYGYSGLVAGDASQLYADVISYIKCEAEL